ncbi:Protein of unknown function [Colwellia chukchiensis]|uniref:DUF2989 domain-containing protein n=1 Tax=Colwellia chukchiensis TaxID=641665 RepID=A0A1H7MM79_9GAMM|nr:DUF2989 domain-containing protein [Colwellia chukchiensis]SEL11785.1 Protein of unknown function [Colwellia chukchiensis]
MNFFKLAALAPLWLLMACEKSQNFAELCQEHKEICLEFQEDSWCKRERIAVGFANLAEKLASQDSNKFAQLIAYENYEKCMEHAAKIEHIKLKVKKTMRTNNVLKARQRINEIANATKGSEHPDLLYYHWSRFLDESALQKFIALEGSKLLEQPHRQINLASYYAKRDANKTLKLLYRALELYPNDAVIDTEIFQSIASIFADKQEYKQAYIWSKILYLYQPDESNITDKSLTDYSELHHLDRQFLDRVAASTLKLIESGEFNAPKV